MVVSLMIALEKLRGNRVRVVHVNAWPPERAVIARIPCDADQCWCAWIVITSDRHEAAGRVPSKYRLQLFLGIGTRTRLKYRQGVDNLAVVGEIDVYPDERPRSLREQCVRTWA